jgi:tRNA 5-methylaminomethyl-2-thiouridine biosynthesis bifunctional protein
VSEDQDKPGGFTPVEWAGATPRSARYDDTYFSAEDGLAESRAVFLTGCGLPGAWAGRRHFTVGELGFGTGLNILALIHLWRQSRPSAAAHLHIFSIEAYPMARVDAERALGHWPELADLAQPLLASWPDRRGWQRLAWPELGVTLDLAIAEVGAALSGWTGRADAWFLDGFAPSRNPEMWRDEVLALIAARSNPGARAASFTVAGAVRRGLEAQGFAVERAPGFGRKKQRLEVRFLGAAAASPVPRVAILGAGIAGAALQRAFGRLGLKARVFDPGGAGAGASGNAAALVTPRLDAGLGAIAELHAQAFARAVGVYRDETLEAIIATGALQLETTPRDGGRFAKIARWEGFAAAALACTEPAETTEALDEPAAPGALAYRDAMVIEPHAILSAWLGDCVERIAVDRLQHDGQAWRLLDPAGALIAEVDVVVLAMGHASAALAPDLRLQAVRGQVSMAEAAFTGAPAAWGGYAIPTRTGVLFGATHERGVDDTAVSAEDHARNLSTLAEARPALAARLADVRLTGRASVRAATADHMPVAGAVPGMEGLYVLSGFGGRGFTLAPILAEKVAADVLGLGGPLPAPLARIVDPARMTRPANEPGRKNQDL